MLAIRLRRGVLTPETVLEESTPKGTPLHDRFEWDNRVAGHAHRLNQAAEIIRSVKVERSEVPISDLRGFINIRPDNNRGRGEYVPFDEAAANPKQWAAYLASIKADLAALTRRHGASIAYREILAQEVHRLSS